MSTIEEYIIQGEPSQRELAEAWQTAIGLQAVDGLHVSRYLKETASQHIEGTISQEEVERRIAAYYQTEESRAEEAGTDEADAVSSRIVKVLGSKTFTFSPSHYASIHRQLFSGILPHAGTYRDYDISKKEWVLNNASVLYGAADYISETLRYDFGEEQKFSYKKKKPEEIIEHVASFIAGIWQIHPFREGNTRTTAVFAIQYLRSLGYKLDNKPFEEHSWYFRNALVRANYDNLPAGITRTTEYLELFFRNILLGEHNELKNRYLHVDWKETSKSQSANQSADSALQSISTEDSKSHFDTLDLSLEEKMILNAIAADPYIKQQQMTKLIHKSIATVKRITIGLQEKGILRRSNGKRDGYWTILYDEDSKQED